MPLESATYISALDSANPAATDQVSQGDKATFPRTRLPALAAPLGGDR